MTADNKARLIHNLAVGMITASAVVVVSSLQRLSTTLATAPLSVKSILIGAIVAAASSGIGILIANTMRDPPPPPPTIH